MSCSNEVSKRADKNIEQQLAERVRAIEISSQTSGSASGSSSKARENQAGTHRINFHKLHFVDSVYEIYYGECNEGKFVACLKHEDHHRSILLTTTNGTVFKKFSEIQLNLRKNLSAVKENFEVGKIFCVSDAEFHYDILKKFYNVVQHDEQQFAMLVKVFEAACGEKMKELDGQSDVKEQSDSKLSEESDDDDSSAVTETAEAATYKINFKEDDLRFEFIILTPDGPKLLCFKIKMTARHGAKITALLASPMENRLIDFHEEIICKNSYIAASDVFKVLSTNVIQSLFRVYGQGSRSIIIDFFNKKVTLRSLRKLANDLKDEMIRIRGDAFLREYQRENSLIDLQI